MSAEREAKIQAIYRDVNERIAEVGGGLFEDADRQFLCECRDPECAAHLSIPIRRYRSVRLNPRRFVILPGHEDPAVERVVERHAAYSIVETFGEAGADAEAPADRGASPAGRHVANAAEAS